MCIQLHTNTYRYMNTNILKYKYIHRLDLLYTGNFKHWVNTNVHFSKGKEFLLDYLTLVL
jgi:hypothetical protein